MSPAVQTAPPSHALRSFEAQWRQRGEDSLAELRELAMKRVLHLGLPTSRDESWRYTNLRHIASQTFVDAPDSLEGEIQPSASLSLISATDRAATVLVVNGHPVLPQGIDFLINEIEISSIREVSRIDPSQVRQHLEPLSDSEQERWALLNTALFVDGLYIKVKSQVTIPLVILHVSTSQVENSVSHPRVIIEVTPGSSATIIEHHVGQGAHTPLCNSATRINLSDSARIEHYRVFATDASAQHIDSLHIRQAKMSECKQFTIVLGGGLVRTSLNSNLEEPQAALDSYALLVGDGSRHVDCVNVARHDAPHTRSRQTARAIASGTSRVVFNSNVVVNAGAAHADSHQSSRGLLLSPSAEIDSRPQLEINADEVKCSHGATTGRLDPDMLFYMLARGIDRETAQSLLIFAFLADVLKDMSVSSARSAIEAALITQLPDSQTLQKFR